MIIAPASAKDIIQVEFLEQAIEGQGAASAATLQARRLMFGDGFLVAKEDGIVQGYIESCLWDKKIPEFNSAPDFFSSHHRVDGAVLYVIFVGVQKELRRHGIGSSLLHTLFSVAAEKPVHAVCRDEHIPFYEGVGFERKCDLPGFLPQGSFNLMVRCHGNPNRTHL